MKMARRKKLSNTQNILHGQVMTVMDSKPPSLLIVVVANLMLLAFLFVLIFSLPVPSLFACTNPVAQSLILAAFMVFILHFFSGAISSLGTKGIGVDPPKFFEIIGTKILIRKYGLSVAIFIVVVIISFWLGSYTYSPFYSEMVQIPVIKGFLVNTSDNKTLSLLSGDGFAMKTTAWASIDVITDPSNVECRWSSSDGGSIDNYKNCRIVFFPALGFDVDLLQVQVSPGCQKPESHGHLKVKIMP